MAVFSVDPSLVLQEASHNALAQRKLDMDALRKRFADASSKEQKLREACEGFEAIFLQQIWQQMRKTVPKGYLHSKSQETYQSMFDVELAKKMASAGGIGLADMLYEQLSQQLENTGRTTTPSTHRQFMPIPPAKGLLPSRPDVESAAASPAILQAGHGNKLSIENLYTPLDQESLDEEFAPPGNANIIIKALEELKAEFGIAPGNAPGAAARDWNAARDAVIGPGPAPAMPTGAAAPSPLQNAALHTAAPPDPTLASWKGPGLVSAKPRPFSSFGQINNTTGIEAVEAPAVPSALPGNVNPGDTLWPLPGDQSAVTSRFGWEDDPASGKRRWNSGVWIAAAPDMPVRAVLPGTVVYTGPREGRGHTVVLEHKEGYRSYYSNLEPGSLRIGDQIRHGAEFARIAAQPSPAVNRENSASLHFELKKGEMALNPESAISRT